MNDTQGVILGVLRKCSLPVTAAQINKIIETEMADFWSSTRSQVYRELEKMVADGLVKAFKPGPRGAVPYKHTGKGTKMLAAWMKKTPKVLIRDGERVRAHLAKAE